MKKNKNIGVPTSVTAEISFYQEKRYIQAVRIRINLLSRILSEFRPDSEKLRGCGDL